MAKSLKVKLLPQALALRAEGVSMPVIAKTLNVAVRTVERWLREESRQRPHQVTEAGGEAKPAGPPLPPDELVSRLEGRLARLIEASDGAADEAKLEDRMLKVCKVLESLRAGRDDLTAQLRAMNRFAAFCLSALSEDEMPPVRKAVRLFMDSLKRESS